MAYLGLKDEAGRLGLEQAVDPQPSLSQRDLFAEDNTASRFVEIDRTRVRVENCRQFGGPWLALELVKRLGLHQFLRALMPTGQEQVPWSLTSADPGHREALRAVERALYRRTLLPAERAG